MIYSEKFVNDLKQKILDQLEAEKKLGIGGKWDPLDYQQIRQRLMAQEIDRLYSLASKYKKMSARYRTWLGWIIIRAKTHRSAARLLWAKLNPNQPYPEDRKLSGKVRS